MTSDSQSLIESLRFCATRNSLSRWKRDLCTEAADKIEQLIKENESLLKQMEELSKSFEPGTSDRVVSNIAYYDQVEVFPDCTVQVLTNTETGDISYGWWKNSGTQDDPEEEE